MGYAAEEAENRAWEGEEAYYRLEGDLADRIWVTRAGERIPLSDMSTNHIRNTIRMLSRSPSDTYAARWVAILQEELEIRS